MRTKPETTQPSPNDVWESALAEFGTNGKPLTLHDAKKVLFADVTPKHIAKGLQQSQRDCPLSISLRDTEDAVLVLIGNKVARVILKTQTGYDARRYTLPSATQKAVLVYDRSGAFTPGRYLFAVPTEARKLGYYPPGKANPKKKRKYNRVSGGPQVIDPNEKHQRKNHNPLPLAA